MRSFPELLKKIREESSLTQEQMGKALGVSTVLVTLIETGKKEASKNFVAKLADRLEVRPGSVIPFVFSEAVDSRARLSKIEKMLISVGEKMQDHLIKVKARKLRDYV